MPDQPTTSTTLPPPLPHPEFSTALMARAQGIRVLFLDVDGVLTDGGLFFGAEGETLKRFNTLDGHGIKLLQSAGIQVAIISGRDCAALRSRLDTLGIKHMALGTEDKIEAAQTILRALDLNWSACAAMGDDWPDLPLMQNVCLALAPANAHRENLACAHWITQATGGNGAVRAVCDLLLWANHQYHVPRGLSTAPSDKL